MSLCIGYSFCLGWPHSMKLTLDSLTHLKKLLNQEVELIFLLAKYTLYLSLSSVYHTALLPVHILISSVLGSLQAGMMSNSSLSQHIRTKSEDDHASSTLNKLIGE